MNLPKLKFRKMTLEENIEIIKWAYYENNDALSVHDYTISYFPELSNLEKNTSKDSAYSLIEKVVKKYYEKYVERINSETERYNKLWKKYSDVYFENLSRYLKIDWPDNLEVIEATVGLIPVFPRYLDTYNFSISTGVDDWKLIETCAHETLHFLWFEKWKQIHPETPRREYDSPYLPWKYSEMVTDPILNNKPFTEIFDFREKGYDSFYQLYDNDNLSVMDNLRNIYSENISIEDKINNGFKYVKNVLEPQKNK